MTKVKMTSRPNGTGPLCLAVLAGALLLTATPANAERASVNSLAADHDDIQAAIDGLDPGEQRTLIDKCQTIGAAGSYVLAKNIGEAGDCLVISAKNVTVDLNGFAVVGKGTGTGIRGDGSLDGVAVSNGTVTGFAFGINLQSVAGATVRDVRVIDNVSGIAVGPGSTVAGNTVFGSTLVGISINDNSIVSGNVVTENGSHGILTEAGNTITGNTAIDNGGVGIGGGVGNTVSGNTANLNGGGGINFLSGSTYSGNTARGNSGSGIVALCPTNVIGNTAISNTGSNLTLNGTPADCNVDNNLAP